MSIKDCLKLDQDKIVARYNNGEGTTSIAKDYNCNSGSIYLFLRDDIGIQMKNPIKNYGKAKQNKDKMISLWNSGLSTKQIAKNINMGSATVLRTLKAWNIDTSRGCTKRDDPVCHHTEEIIKLYNSGTNMQQLAEKYHTNSGVIYELLKKNNIKTRKCNKYTFDQTFFEKIDTQEKAYFLGWMYSDGNVRHSGINRIQCADIEILEKLNRTISNTAPIVTRQPPKKYPHRKVQYLLTFHSAKVTKDLIKLGCMPAKSLILEFPTVEQVPVELLSHFIRGYFDGDGSLYKCKDRNYHHIGIVSTERFLMQLVTHFAPSKYEIFKRKKKSKTTTRQLRFCRKDDIVQFLKWIYKDSTIHLERKHELAKQYLDI